jgi:light-regulated signal transduction histidine kinase (bacteriophytochrome)
MPAQDAETVDETRAPAAAAEREPDELQIQPASFLIQLSLDWIVLRASENVDDFLGESHVTLIEEPLSRFVKAQALHDLRNLFSRLSGSTGIARAYRVRLTDDPPFFDIAFQVSEGRVLLEAMQSPERKLGQAMGSVGGLIDGLSRHQGQTLLDGAARRVRALTGCDRASIVCGNLSGSSSRREAASALLNQVPDLPPIVSDTAAAPVPIFPRKPGDRSIAQALHRSPSAESLRQLRDQGIGSMMSVPLHVPGEGSGAIQCASRSSCAPNLEQHAAAELFAQMLALRVEIDRLRGENSSPSGGGVSAKR